MMQANPSVKQIAEMARMLTPPQKMQLLKRIISDMEISVNHQGDTQKSHRNLYGICKSFGEEPSEKDIAAVRKEIFSDFPRDI